MSIIKFTIPFFSFAVLVSFTFCAHAQKEFFRSQQVFAPEQLNNFYSTVTLHDDLVLFAANDYNLYAYNKKDGGLQWMYETGYKSSTPCFVMESLVITGVSKNKIANAAMINLQDGAFIKDLPFGPLVTKASIKDGILYSTGIYNYGCIIAYDLQNDTVAWSRFIGHGYSRQPYYFSNKIIANAEGNNWVAIDYNGVLLDTSCAEVANIFVEDIPCVKTFTALAHNGKEIKGKLSKDIFKGAFVDQPEMLVSENFTFILFDDHLTILNGKLKIKQQVKISSLLKDVIDTDNAKLVKADDVNTWILLENYLLQYNHKAKKLARKIDLTKWQPHSVLLEENKLWLISAEDGLLYGLSI